MGESVSGLPRHRLASLFDPQSLRVVSDVPLPIFDTMPAALGANAHVVTVEPDQPIVLDDRHGPQARLDLAVVCVPPARLAQALDALAVLCPYSLLILRHPCMSDDPDQDAALCRQWGERHDCVVLGPNSFGLQRPHRDLNLCLDPYLAPAGRVAVVAQSTSIMAAVLDWAEDISLGFSAALSIGVESAVDVSEVLDFLAMDSRTDSIVLVLEHPLSSRRFTSALHAAASVKPVMVLKPGRHPADHDPAVQQHAASANAVLNALLRRVGAVRVRYFIQLFSALKVLVHSSRPRGRRIAIVSNGSTAARLALDAMGPDAAVFPAELGAATQAALAHVLEPGAAARNPVVTRRPWKPDDIAHLVQLLADDAGVDGVLVLLAPDHYADINAVADRLAQLTESLRKPVISCFMGDAGMRDLRKRLDRVGAPAFRTPESAVEGFGLLASYHYSQVLAQQSLPPEPLSWPPRLDEARRLLQQARDQGRTTLDDDECRRLMECFYIPVDVLARGESGVGESAGAALRVARDVPPMAIRMVHDARYGPAIAFGASRSLEWVADSSRSVDLPPLNRYLARQLVQRSTLWRRVLSRQLSPAALELVYEALERVSDMVCELPGLASVCIDPLYADDRLMQAGAIRITLRESAVAERPETTGYRHLAIHPYPRRLVQEMEFSDGQPWLRRPIRPEDAELLQEFIRNLSDESRYMRFVSMLRELTPRMLARYTTIDYDRELALVATITEPNPEHRGYPRDVIIGFAHYLRNADGQGAEYALAISDDWQRRGLGACLMRGLIDAARDQGLTYIDGYVLANNRPMLGLMTHLGFQNDRDAEDPGMRRVWLDLTPSPASSFRN